MGAAGARDVKDVAGKRGMVSQEKVGGGGGDAEEYDGSTIAEGGGEE